MTAARVIHAAKNATNGVPTRTWCGRDVVGGMVCVGGSSVAEYSDADCKDCRRALDKAAAFWRQPPAVRVAQTEARIRAREGTT
jgi:hypothetical protein